MAFEILVLSLNDLPRLKHPFTGLAEAMIPTLHFSWQITPAFAIEIVCCSMTYRRDEESLTLSNSSIAQIPLSDRMRAPAYKAC